MKKLFPLAIVVLFLLFQFCVQPPDYPVAPEIKYIGISKDTMLQGSNNQDFIIVTFSFTDGDGDLGYAPPDPTPSVFYFDSRDSFPKDPIQLPYVEPQGAGNGISGEITVKLSTSCCISKVDNLTCEDVPISMKFDTVSYFIMIRDRAGHESNTIKTEAITLICRQ